MLNKLKIHFNNNYTNYYWINSKLKPTYTLGVQKTYGNFNLGLCAFYEKVEYNSKDFVGSVTINDGNHNGFESFVYYNVYQTTKLNQFSFFTEFGYYKKINLKSQININGMFGLDYKFNIYSTNHYVSYQEFGNDTNRFELHKNFKSGKKYAPSPSVGLAISYDYEITKRALITCKVNFLAHLSIPTSLYHHYDSDQYSENVFVDEANYEYRDSNVHDIQSQFIIVPSIGIKYRL